MGLRLCWLAEGRFIVGLGCGSLRACWVGYVGVLKCVCVKIGMDIIMFGLGSECVSPLQGSVRTNLIVYLSQAFGFVG